MHYDDIKDALYPDTQDVEDFSYQRVRRLLDCVKGEQVSTFSGNEGIEQFSPRVQPHSPGLISRMWYGAGSARSARWAAENGMNFLTSNVVAATESSTDFDDIQLDLIKTYRKHSPEGRVSHGFVVIPTDGASADQRARYEEYAANRATRYGKPFGPRGLLFARDIVGTSEQIAEQLRDNAAFREVEEVAFALPFTFEHADYVQILTDMATKLGPALGWHAG
jgi:alkanesulfonate monooxygenase SsuD/methylene tetrahydromethanopterin reductase-like flavin-dependent oxidoreductase (luciferase family)